MAIIKCKMCGGDLNITEGLSVAECEYCGSKQTIPNVDDEKKLVLFERAERLRRNCEFDKAAGVYESIVADFRTESEAYWGLVLCRFGIEYVDDPATGKKVPTCHRSSFDSVMDDPNFEQALENTDAVARRVYREEAKAIEDLRKGIIEVSSTEEPYDIFINYKETDDKGDRTLDSVIAQDIYDALCDKGYRVFFSRITLEDKLGTEYEPYIFAALNSAKLMISVGTDYEHFNAVWVKNEWSRFLQLIAKGEKKTLIPCFKNIDAYDMPKEFAKLSAQDMGKVGAMQDLLRGVEKIIPPVKNPFAVTHERVIVGGTTGNKIASLLDRGNMALEDGDWAKANSFFEDVLNNDSKNSQAYLGKVLADEQCRTPDALIRLHSQVSDVNVKTLELPADHGHIADMVKKFAIEGYLEAGAVATLYDYSLNYKSSVAPRKEQLENKKKWFENNRPFVRAEQFASAEMAELLGHIKDSILSKYNAKLTEAKKTEAEEKQKLLAAYEQHIAEADKKAAAMHSAAISERERDYLRWTETIEKTSSLRTLNEIAGCLDNMNGYKDSAAFAKLAREKAADEQAKLDAAANKRKKEQQAKAKKIGIVSAVVAILAIAAILVITKIVIPSNNYKEAEALYAEGKYAHAAMAYGRAGSYKDAHEKWLVCAEKAGNFDAIAAGFQHTVGLKSDGTVVAVGENSDGRCSVSDWTDIVDISVGGTHTVGLKADGSVVAAGANSKSQCNVSNWTNIVAISAGSNHTVGLMANGSVVAVGENNYGQCNVFDWTDIVAISAGGGHTVGLKSDGTVVAVGNNEYDQCKVSGWKDVVAISAGDAHTVVLRADGKVFAEGYNYFDQTNTSSWKNIVDISAGVDHTIGLKSDGTVVAVGNNNLEQCKVSSMNDIVAISAGWFHTVGLKSDGTVVAVGSNGYYQCDVSDWTGIKVPKGIEEQGTESVNPASVLKEVKLDVNLIEGAGATSENTKVTIEPQSVVLTGDLKVLKGVNKIVLATIDLTDFATSFEETYTIPLDNNVVSTTGITRAEVNVEISGLETKTVSVSNISCINITDGFRVNIITQNLDVTLRGNPEILAQIKNENIRAVADLTDMNESTGTYMPKVKIYIDGFRNVGALGESSITIEIERT